MKRIGKNYLISRCGREHGLALTRAIRPGSASAHVTRLTLSATVAVRQHQTARSAQRTPCSAWLNLTSPLSPFCAFLRPYPPSALCIRVTSRPLVVGIFGTGFREIRVNPRKSGVKTQGSVVRTEFTAGLAPGGFSVRSAPPREKPDFSLANDPPKPPKLPSSTTDWPGPRLRASGAAHSGLLALPSGCSACYGLLSCADAGQQDGSLSDADGN